MGTERKGCRMERYCGEGERCRWERSMGEGEVGWRFVCV